jgi:hypothetical protein
MGVIYLYKDGDKNGEIIIKHIERRVPEIF